MAQTPSRRRRAPPARPPRAAPAGRRARAGSAPCRRSALMPASTSARSAAEPLPAAPCPARCARQTRGRASAPRSHRDVGPPRASGRTSRSRRIIGPRVMIAERVARLARAPRWQPRVSRYDLRRAGRVGRGADRDRLALPGPPREFAAQHLDDVRLDADRGAVAVVGGPVGGARSADVAEGAAVGAAHVRVQRPLERHALNPVERRPAGLLAVFDRHGRTIANTTFARKEVRGGGDPRAPPPGGGVSSSG